MNATETPVDAGVGPETGSAPGGCEDINIDGKEMVAKVRELIHEGNVRRIIIKNAEGTTLIEIPLTLGVVGAVVVPSLAAVGAIAAVVTDCSITVERQAPPAET